MGMYFNNDYNNDFLKDVNPISKTEIAIAYIKGIFPFISYLTLLQLVMAIAYVNVHFSIWIAIIPYGIVALYYIGYFVFIKLCKLTIFLINKTNKR
jgi:hypothetical protein